MLILKINDNEAYIELKVDGFEDIVEEYSLSDRIVLKEEFINAILNRVAYMPLDYPFVLQIYNKSFTSSEKILVRKLIKNYFTLSKIDKEIELKKVRRKVLFFLIFAIIGFALAFFTKIEILKHFKELATFIASFSVWECSELILFGEDDLKEDIIKYSHLSKIRVVFNKEDS